MWLHWFFKNLNKTIILSASKTSLEAAGQTTTDLLNTYSDDDYIKKIQKRLEEDAFAREQREKRRRRLLMDQLIAHEAQEVKYLDTAWIIVLESLQNLVFYTYIYVSSLFITCYSESNVNRTHSHHHSKYTQKKKSTKKHLLSNLKSGDGIQHHEWT